jgi:hypothetical protein
MTSTVAAAWYRSQLLIDSEAPDDMIWRTKEGLLVNCDKPALPPDANMSGARDTCRRAGFPRETTAYINTIANYIKSVDSPDPGEPLVTA